VVIWVAPFVVGFLENLIDSGAEAPADLEWRKLNFRWQNTTSARDATDDNYVGFDFLNITSGAVDNTWTTGDYTTMEALADTFATSLGTVIPSNHDLMNYRWYRRGFNPYSSSKPFKESGPPLRVTTKNIVGGAASSMPPQVALSVTEKTPWPSHWGRFYLPLGSGTIIASGGKIATSTVDAVANATNTFYNAAANAGFYPVVPVTQVNKTAQRLLLGVTQIQVDDVADVIRRRRYAAPTYKKILP